MSKEFFNLYAALEDPNGHCPYLRAEWNNDRISNFGTPEKYHLTYDDYQDGYLFWATNDWWAPNYFNGFVKVGCGPSYRVRKNSDAQILRNQDGQPLTFIIGWMISVWGLDDDGCNRLCRDQEEARAIILKMPLILEKEHLFNLGFQW